MEKREWETRFVKAVTELRYLAQYLDLESTQFTPDLFANDDMGPTQGWCDEMEAMVQILDNLIVNANADEVVAGIEEAASR
jgi:hypothetical protein